MAEEIVMVSTCPLCAGPEETLSMVTLEIDRIIPKGRAAILICRSCAGAVIDATCKLDPPLLSYPLSEVLAAADPVLSSTTWSAAAAIYGAFGDDWWPPDTSEPDGQENSDDDSSTD